MVSAITYWFEYFRYHYHIDIESRNQILQQEITERKRAEKSLHEGERKYREFPEVNPSLISPFIILNKY